MSSNPNDVPDAEAHYVATPDEIQDILDMYEPLQSRASEIVQMIHKSKGYSPVFDVYPYEVDVTHLPNSTLVCRYMVDGEIEVIDVPLLWFAMPDRAIKQLLEDSKEAKKRREQEQHKEMLEQQHLKNRASVKTLLEVALERYPGLLEEVLAKRAEQPC